MKLFKVNFYRLLLPIFLLVVFFLDSSAQIIPSSVDLSYLLNSNADINLTHKVVTKNNKNWVILQVSTFNNTNPDSLVFEYAFVNKLGAPLNNFNKILLKNFELYKTDGKKMYAFEPTTNSYTYLVLRIFHLTTNKNYTYIINLETSSSFFLSKTLLTLPIIKGYSSIETPIKIAKLNGKKSNFIVNFYSTNFSAALPPMATLKTEPPLNKIDTSFIILSNAALENSQEGVYSIFEEHNEHLVSFFRITKKRYPQFSTIEELIEASVYLFTQKEKNRLTVSTNAKKDYDAFWLENTNSSERAGKMISAYFLRVKEANTLFSTYKEGWKTDMGMIYIIFGPPDKVFKTNEKVEWVYKKTYEMPNLVFNFYVKTKNTDSEYFNLERKIEYQNTWFRAIDLWRKGRKNL